ncbi:glycogen metabolism-related protein [Trichosporon asahii var. asahii CBS 8904]|uniref:Glycogen metabolism-related protein n=1 Tax=Trichosporon asahii var. asahii (strain CBS 8904) TaxID=1220162 RepID=K1WN32_TRIAC|nr:glycogen metabolism-related protein [Trichosporon asahii var. asahii CBS 8904]
MPGLNPRQEEGVTLEGAIEDYFAAQTAGGAPPAANPDEEDELDAALEASAAEGGARTLDGRPAEALPEEWRNRGAGRFASLSAMLLPDLTGSGGPPSEPETTAAPSRAFRGAGNTLGSEDTPSVTVGGGGGPQRIPGAFGDDDDEEEEELETAQRRLIFWRDGFSIEDGELYRYDEPRNQELLQAIHAGRAPLSLFDVQFNQPLQLVVEQRTDEEYQPPPKKPMKAFSGGGNRLGSADDEPAASSSTTAAATAGPAANASAPAPATEIKVDPGKPSTNVQLRLGDGLVARVNLDHTVADLRAFVAGSRPDSRPFVLQTTFPSRELPDSETVEQAKLQNAVVVQRFT